MSDTKVKHRPLVPVIYLPHKEDMFVFFVYKCTYLLTPWYSVLLEKLTGLQLVKKFPAFHRTRRLITALTSVRHLSLSWASPIQSIYPHPTSWRSFLILSTHLRLGLPSGLLPSGFLSIVYKRTTKQNCTTDSNSTFSTMLIYLLTLQTNIALQ